MTPVLKHLSVMIFNNNGQLALIQHFQHKKLYRNVCFPFEFFNNSHIILLCITLTVMGLVQCISFMAHSQSRCVYVVVSNSRSPLSAFHNSVAGTKNLATLSGLRGPDQYQRRIYTTTFPLPTLSLATPHRYS